MNRCQAHLNLAIAMPLAVAAPLLVGTTGPVTETL